MKLLKTSYELKECLFIRFFSWISCVSLISNESKFCFPYSHRDGKLSNAETGAKYSSKTASRYLANRLVFCISKHPQDVSATHSLAFCIVLANKFFLQCKIIVMTNTHKCLANSFSRQMYRRTSKRHFSWKCVAKPILTRKMYCQTYSLPEYIANELHRRGRLMEEVRYRLEKVSYPMLWSW